MLYSPFFVSFVTSFSAFDHTLGAFVSFYL